MGVEESWWGTDRYVTFGDRQYTVESQGEVSGNGGFRREKVASSQVGIMDG